LLCLGAQKQDICLLVVVWSRFLTRPRWHLSRASTTVACCCCLNLLCIMFCACSRSSELLW
jgi:hypothetical protein